MGLATPGLGFRFRRDVPRSPRPWRRTRGRTPTSEWRFRFGEATYADEDADAEITWRFGALRVTEDLLNGGGSGSDEAVDLVGAGMSGLPSVVGGLPYAGRALQIPRELQDAFRPVPRA